MPQKMCMLFNSLKRVNGASSQHKLVIDIGKRVQITCSRVNCADKEVASVCRVCTFLSSSAMYLILRSFDLAADCLFAQILLEESMKHGSEIKKQKGTKRVKNLLVLTYSYKLHRGKFIFNWYSNLEQFFTCSNVDVIFNQIQTVTIIKWRQCKNIVTEARAFNMFTKKQLKKGLIQWGSEAEEQTK